MALKNQNGPPVVTKDRHFCISGMAEKMRCDAQTVSKGKSV